METITCCSLDDNVLEIAVFGDVRGYWEAWQRHGRLQWADLFEPTINLCENGFVVGQALGEILESPTFRRRARTNEGNMRLVLFICRQNHMNVSHCFISKLCKCRHHISSCALCLPHSHK